MCRGSLEAVWIGSKLMQNTGKLLSGELLRRGHSLGFVYQERERSAVGNGCVIVPMLLCTLFIHLWWSILQTAEPPFNPFPTLKRRECLNACYCPCYLTNWISPLPHMFASIISSEYLKHVRNVIGNTNIWNPCLHLWVDGLPQKL